MIPKKTVAAPIRTAMKATSQMLLALGLLLAPVEVIAASCSSYYISEITLVSPGSVDAAPLSLGFRTGALTRDPDGHGMRLVAR